MPESLENQFISDLYTSLLHLSGAELTNKLNKVFDGAGNSTGLALSGDRVVINNYIYPKGYATAVEWLDAFWPVGSVKLTFNDQNPGEIYRTNIPPNEYLVRNNGFLFDLNNFDDSISKTIDDIDETLNNKKYYYQKSQKSFEFINKNLVNSKCYQKMEIILKNL